MSSAGLDNCDAMALIGQSKGLSTALPRNKNLLHTCWITAWLCCITMAPLILVLCIVSLRHIVLVHFGMVHAVVCLLCVEIVSKLFACSLAWTHEPGACCVVVPIQCYPMYRLPVQSHVSM